MLLTDDIPDSLGAWDSLPQRSMLQGAQEHDKERQAHCEWVVAEVRRAIDGERTTEPLRFIAGQPTALQAVAQGLDHGDLMDQMAQLLIDVAAGHRMHGHAAELLRNALECFGNDKARPE